MTTTHDLVTERKGCVCHVVDYGSLVVGGDDGSIVNDLERFERRQL
jgi:hypothetical protein